MKLRTNQDFLWEAWTDEAFFIRMTILIHTLITFGAKKIRTPLKGYTINGSFLFLSSGCWPNDSTFLLSAQLNGHMYKAFFWKILYQNWLKIHDLIFEEIFFPAWSWISTLWIKLPKLSESTIFKQMNQGNRFLDLYV